MSFAKPNWLRGSLIAASSLVAFGACNSGGNTLTNARCPCSMSAVAGDEQTGLPGAALADDLVIQIVDTNDQPILGVTVIWQVASGGGSIQTSSVGGGIPGESITDPGGFNSAEWTLGSEVGAQTVRVTSLVSSDVVTFTGTAVLTSALALRPVHSGEARSN